ncbi:DUF494 family protein [candidate division KSB1 bacterium]|nr:DUF494 family protein [candidate division KSB1 bacterium]
MNERVMEIIAYIVKEMESNQALNDGDGFKVLTQKLEDDGYSQTEINFAFSWIFEKIDNKGKNDEFSVAARRSQRLLHDFEKIAISPAAYGYLIQLREFELIDPVEMEQIIEKALLHSTESMVSLHDMRRIVANMIFRPDDIMEGSFFLIDNSYNVH